MVVRYDERPTPGLTTLLTFGLSHEVLDSTAGPLREELIAVVRRDQADGALATRLSEEAARCERDRRAIVPDDISAIGNVLGSRTEFRGFWVTRPHGFGEGFDTVTGADTRFAIAQIVPLTLGEHDRALSVGGHEFGHEVERHWEELVDLDRMSLFERAAAPGGFRWAGLRDFEVDGREDRVHQAQIDRLRPGDIAKLGFLIEPVISPGPVSEQMWVEVDSIDGGRLVGRLANVPTYLLDLPEGTVIEFQPRHVLDVRLDRAP